MGNYTVYVCDGCGKEVQELTLEWLRMDITPALVHAIQFSYKYYPRQYACSNECAATVASKGAVSPRD